MDSWPAPEVARLPGHGLPLRVYDTARAAVVPTAPGPEATLYVCGITPYDATHLGHAATYVAFDLLQRVWRDAGHRVRYVQNVTDVDDPLLERAGATGEDWADLATREIALFREDMATLRVLPPDEYVGVTEAIPVVVDLIERLRERGAAYQVGDDVYFSVASYPRLGSVAHLDVPTMLALSAERGGDPDRPGKKDPLDCLLWQAARAGEPAWDSTLGPGRPGWHVECTAIAVRTLGDTVDVVGGGSDLAFPHHELGAAEAEVATGVTPFGRTFVHTGMVGLDGEKMSKSQGNLVLVSELRGAGVDPMALRMALLAHHYREDWSWTPEDLAAGTARLARWRDAADLDCAPSAEPLLAEVRRLLADDLRAPAALQAVDRWVEDSLLGHGTDEAAPALLGNLVDALLGIRL